MTPDVIDPSDAPRRNLRMTAAWSDNATDSHRAEILHRLAKLRHKGCRPSMTDLGCIKRMISGYVQRATHHRKILSVNHFPTGYLCNAQL